MKNKIRLKTIALVFLQCFLFYSITLASLPDKNFNIPSQYGTIKESFKTTGNQQDVERTIIHIQDAHCNYEAQKNMAGLLEYLVKEQNLKLIMVEGGSGNVNLSFLRSYADEKARIEVADKYLKEGKISGEEYLDIVSDYPIELYGIEDEALYDAHMAAFEQVDSFREEGLRYLENLTHIVKNLKPLIYTEELRQLEEKKSKYDDKAISLVEYCQYLNEMANKKNLELKDYPHLTAFCEIARLEKEIDFQEAESERNAFIKDLAKLLDEKGVQGLINKTQDFKAKKITQEEYYSFLKTVGDQKLDLKQNYPQLNAYIKYVTISKDVNAADLLKEVSVIEEKIKVASFTNADQRRLNEIAKSSQILSKILNLELTPEDYEYFKANRLQFLTSSWVSFLTEKCSSYNLQMQASTSNLIDENLNALDGFYQLGVEREKAFIKNMVNKMNESGEKLAVLITGGFHTPGITQMLKDKGYSYVVATPVITQKSDSSIYFSVLRGEKRRLKESFDVDGEEEY